MRQCIPKGSDIGLGEKSSIERKILGGRFPLEAPTDESEEQLSDSLCTEDVGT